MKIWIGCVIRQEEILHQSKMSFIECAHLFSIKFKFLCEQTKDITVIGATKPVTPVQNPVPASLVGSCHPNCGHCWRSTRDGRHQGQGQDWRTRGQDRERDATGGDQGGAGAYRGGAEGPGDVGTAGKGRERKTGKDCPGKCNI